MSEALRSVRDLSLPAACGRVIRPPLAALGAADRYDYFLFFSGRG